MENLSHPVPERGRPTRAAFKGNSRQETAYTIRVALAKVRQKYLHPPLPPDHTRLILLHPPANGVDELNIELVPVAYDDLGTRYQYEALSYHWGSAEQGLRTVYVRRNQDNGAAVGVPDSGAQATLRNVASKAHKALIKKIWLRTSLYMALRRLRLPTRPVLLWIDFICIDQDNNKEKEEQVARMVDIYSRANRVVIWLGDEDARSRNAMQFIQDIVKVDSLDGLVADQKTIKSWGDLMHLMQNPWFSRRWVIQEMAYAQQATVHLAEIAIPWDDLRDAVSLFVLNLDKIRTLLQPLLELSTGLGHGVLLHDHLGSMDFLLRNNLDSLPAKVFIDILDYMFRKPKNGLRPNPTHGLEFLTATLYIYQNSDPRDTIHALRSIALETSTATIDSTILPPPKPDYTLDLLDVYTGFVRWVVETTGSIDILCRHWALPEREKGATNYPAPVELPSWIRIASDEERSRRGVKSDSLVGLPGQRIYDASKSSRAKVDFSPQHFESPIPIMGGSWQDDQTQEGDAKDASINVRGILIGSLDWTTDPITDGVVPEVALRKLRAATPGEEVPDQLWRTLVAERGEDGRNPPPWYYRACRYCLTNKSPNGHLNTDKLLTQTQPGIVRAFLQRVQAATWNRRVVEVDVVDARPLYGLAPAGSRKGDLVCVLFGCSVPCVLRLCQEDDGRYYFEFIGEACVYGLMDGEAIASLTGAELELRSYDFRLL
ncbi:uncharacterized protein MYCGRDRAFT_69322 [Zymoseptoria tritici IPO323]|uniref:Heterokaryon incompatibility domain-containing protein n=1 Tax=Zymoseptoria tritici (strain CBS 115943 / IPO323) TaxID=336722 RepID=F9X6L7_ZYMTI|nr:uncharacterized protein MYCGRDRAFT_69322 [Zymoseptoria tritici IPO323]EGP89585.1 hypothetical protein MYCGRDRAFT_69322 [Zymoseptoria tritici IPO323]